MANQKNRTILIIAVVLVIVVAVSYTILQSGNNEEEQEPSYKILFIGDSLTDWNGGLDQHIETLASSADPPLIIKADKIIQYSTPLEGLWEETNARTNIEGGDYDAVILQEALPFTFIETFNEYAHKFDTVIKKAGAETVLLMPYSVEDPAVTVRLPRGYVPMGTIEKAHRDIAEELDCMVAPWGLAFHRVVSERPDLNLYQGDNIHPSIYGTYLAVNVVYATIFDENPEGLTYRPKAVSEDDAEFLQRIAWEIVQEYRTQ